MEKLLNVLTLKRAEVATSALMNPADRTQFEYGRVSGQYQGLTMAIEAVKEIMADKDEDDE